MLIFLILGAEERIIEENGAMDDHEAQMLCMIQSSGKLVLVDKLLKKLREGGHKVLIFSQMTRCLDILTDFLRWRGYPCERIDGAVKGDERQAAIDRYCDPNSNSFVFLLCTKAGGVGINLTAADTVVIFDSDWNPQNDLQAQARCHRIGQTKSVKIYRLITRNTYEREMFDRAGMKLGLDKAILQKMGPETSGLEDLSESSATPKMSKSQVEDLLKKGAYGILMENDESSMKFMDEDIDSILERRTTVIKHDSGAKESRSAMDGSIFSKASFAATADDLDLDMDDPNFWELWAKKMNVDPSQVHSAGVSAAVDDSRIRRVMRRLLNHSKNDFSQLLAAFPCTLTENENEDEKEPVESCEEVKLWTEEERLSLMSLLLRFGLTAFDRIRPFFANRSQNDLLAATKILLKTCIEQVAEEEPKFKEDCDKLLLSKIEFDRYDKKTTRQAVLEDEEGTTSSAASGSTEFSKADIPYSGASRKQIIEFRSFYKDENCPESYRQSIQENARNILITLQTVELLRKILEEIGGSVGKTGGIEAFGALTIPNSAGAGPATWWDRDEDLALLIGTIRYGFGEFEEIKSDSSLAWQHQLQKGAEFPEDSKVFERIFKVVVAIEKRNRASAKLAMHSMSFGGAGRRRVTFDDEEEAPVPFGSRKSRFNRDDDDDIEEYEEPSDEKRGRGRPKRKKTFSSAEARFLSTWSKAERAEFNRLINSYGLPPGEDGNYDWSVFRDLMMAGKVSIEDQSEADEVEETTEEATSSSAKLTGKSDEDLNKYLEIYLMSCSQASERPARRRGRPSKNGKIVDEDDFDEFEEEDLIANVPSDSLIEMAPERAKKSLSRIELFNKIRSPEIFERENLAEILIDARRSSGLPRWWVIGAHDEALLRGAAKFGFGRPDLIVKEISAFKEVLDQINSGDLNLRESRRKTPTISDVPSGLDSSASSSGNYPVVDGIDVNKLNWPNELIILRRLELIVEMLSSSGTAATESTESPTKRGRKEKESTTKSPKTPKAPKAPKEPKEPKEPKSPKVTKAKNPPRSAKSAAATELPPMPSPEDFPEIHPGRTKRQRTLTDFGFNKSK